MKAKEIQETWSLLLSNKEQLASKYREEYDKYVDEECAKRFNQEDALRSAKWCKKDLSMLKYFVKGKLVAEIDGVYFEKVKETEKAVLIRANFFKTPIEEWVPKSWLIDGKLSFNTMKEKFSFPR